MAISDRFSDRPGQAEINANIQAGRSNQQGSYQVGGYNTGSGSPYIAKPNNTKISQYYQQMNALQNEPQNYFQQAMTDINATGVFDPIMQNIKEQMGWAHPYGSSIGDQQLAQQVAAIMAQYVSPYAQMLSNQAFQRNQNLINQAAGLYGQQQGLNQQGAIAAGQQWLQAQQLGQQANQWQQQFDRQQDWYNRAQQQARLDRLNSGGGTQFLNSESVFDRPQMDWDADGNLVPVGTGGSSSSAPSGGGAGANSPPSWTSYGGGGSSSAPSGGGWMSNVPTYNVGGGVSGGAASIPSWTSASTSAGMYY